MKRTIYKGLNLATEQAVKALHLLIAEGKLAVRDVRAVLKRERLIQELRNRLAALGADGLKAIDKPAPRAKRRVSAARRAAMKVQGKYMAAIRRLPKAARVKIKVIREKSGVRAAIAAARDSK